MSPIQKTSAAASELGISSHITDPIFQKRLNEQNIWEILSTLPGEYTKQDIIDYLKMRRDQLADLVQDFKTMSVYAEPEEISIAKIPEMNMDVALSDADCAELVQMIVEAMSGAGAGGGEGGGAMEEGGAGGAGGKFAAVGKTSAGGGTKTARTPDNILSNAQNTYDDAMNLLDMLEDKWFETQLRLDLGAKDSELRSEVQRILALARSGRIDAVWVLVAIAKVSASRNGFLFTQFGKRLYRLNEEADNIVKDLLAKSPADMQYAGYLQQVSQQQKEIGTQQQFLIQDMQKLTQNIETVISFAKGSIDEIFKTKLQLVNNMRTS